MQKLLHFPPYPSPAQLVWGVVVEDEGRLEQKGFQASPVADAIISKYFF